MEGKVVQLVQGREKALEADSPDEMLRRFAAFPQIQVIDLDAAMGRGANDELVAMLASKAVTRVGGGVRTVARAETLIAQGAFRVIVGTSAFHVEGPNHAFLQPLVDAIGRERIVLALDSKGGRIVVKGWQEATQFTAEELIQQLEPYCAGFLCTYVDKEGMMQGTDLRLVPAAFVRQHEQPKSPPPLGGLRLSRTSARSKRCGSTRQWGWQSTPGVST